MRGKEKKNFFHISFHSLLNPKAMRKFLRVDNLLLLFFAITVNCPHVECFIQFHHLSSFLFTFYSCIMSYVKSVMMFLYQHKKFHHRQVERKPEDINLMTIHVEVKD
ncbi:hypothetical protein ACKWTF_005561 [Chironomus riparius]